MCYTYELAFGIHTNFMIIIIKAQSAIVPFKHKIEGIALLRQHIVPLCLTVPYPMFIRRSVSRIACIWYFIWHNQVLSGFQRKCRLICYSVILKLVLSTLHELHVVSACQGSKSKISIGSLNEFGIKSILILWHCRRSQGTNMKFWKWIK